MARDNYVCRGRTFRNDADYKKALHDLKIIEQYETRVDNLTDEEIRRLVGDIRAGRKPFYSILGTDYADELEQILVERKVKREAVITGFAQKKLAGKERKRKILLLIALSIVLCCGCCLGFYYYDAHSVDVKNAELIAIKNSSEKNKGIDVSDLADASDLPEYHVTLNSDEGTVIEKNVLEEFKSLLNRNKNLIGWLTIDDISNGSPFIDLPVMQCEDNVFYLSHDIDDKSDRNGTVFLDTGCDVVTESMNYILYGHHMKSGKMFGKLDSYSDYEFYKDHKTIRFDTLYEKGTYEVMYVFRSHVYNDDEIVFKYYQFIDADSPQEFDSYMAEMAGWALYDTGVKAEYGDHLLTLSTCDYQETNGRFVVVAKKVTEGNE